MDEEAPREPDAGADLGSANVSFEQLANGNFWPAERLAREYLGNGDDAGLARAYATNPDLAVVCREGAAQIIIGVCFGWASGEDASLQGIAVASHRAGRGIGSRLIRYFEDACRNHGCTRISVGSAEGYVEHFYLKNGYRPIEFYVTLDHQPTIKSLDGFDVLRTRKTNGRVQLNIRANGYDARQQDEIRRRLAAPEVNYIFETRLDGSPPPADRVG